MILGGADCGGGTGTSSLAAVTGEKGDKGEPGDSTSAVDGQLQTKSLRFVSKSEHDDADEGSHVGDTVTISHVSSSGEETAFGETGALGFTTYEACNVPKDDSPAAKKSKVVCDVNLPVGVIVSVNIKNTAGTSIGKMVLKLNKEDVENWDSKKEILVHKPSQYLTTAILDLIQTATFNFNRSMLQDQIDFYTTFQSPPDASDNWKDETDTAVTGIADVLEYFKLHPKKRQKFGYDPICFAATEEGQASDYTTADTTKTAVWKVATDAGSFPFTNAAEECELTSLAGTAIEFLEYRMYDNNNTDADGNGTDNTDAQVICGEFDHDLISGLWAHFADPAADVANVHWYAIRGANFAADNDEANYEEHNDTIMLGMAVESDGSPDDDVELKNGDGIDVNLTLVSNIVAYSNLDDTYAAGGSIDIGQDTDWLIMSATTKANLTDTSVLYLFEKCTNSQDIEFTATDGSGRVRLSAADDIMIKEEDKSGSNMLHVQMVVTKISDDANASRLLRLSQEAPSKSDSKDLAGHLNPNSSFNLADGTTRAMSNLQIARYLATSKANCSDARRIFNVDSAGVRKEGVVGRMGATNTNVVQKGLTPHVTTDVTLTKADGIVVSHTNYADEDGRLSDKFDTAEKGDKVTITVNNGDPETCEVQ